MFTLGCDSLGDVWLKSLALVMKHGVFVKDDCRRVRDIANVDVNGKLKDDDLYQKIKAHWSYNSETQTLDEVNLKEVRDLHFTIASIERDDPIIVKYANQDRIDYTIFRYGPTSPNGYGSRIYGTGDNFNQFDYLVDLLRKKPESKSATISTHRPGEKPDCLSLVDFKYRNNKLDINIAYRSQNVYTKQPGNLLSLRILQNSLANALGFEVGSVSLWVMSAHIYEFNYGHAMEILKTKSLWN